MATRTTNSKNSKTRSDASPKSGAPKRGAVKSAVIKSEAGRAVPAEEKRLMESEEKTKRLAKPAAKKIEPTGDIEIVRSANPASLELSHDQIAARAWEIWHEEGCPFGCEVEHWLRAEHELRSRNAL
jgi:hypothetical protein